jgi:glycerol-3-phosphate dehydrogenase
MDAISAQPEYDLLIIGGGVNGTGIARDAAGRGMRVYLAEQGDLAGATSSASTKLIHGGLRYLEYYDFRLVREALQERKRLIRIAPHIIWPLRFVLPHQNAVRPAWMIRIGLFLYDHLAGKQAQPACLHRHQIPVPSVRLRVETGYRPRLCLFRRLGGRFAARCPECQGRRRARRHHPHAHTRGGSAA